jgi:hypothetical protein
MVSGRDLPWNLVLELQEHGIPTMHVNRVALDDFFDGVALSEGWERKRISGGSQFQLVLQDFESYCEKQNKRPDTVKILPINTVAGSDFLEFAESKQRQPLSTKPQAAPMQVPLIVQSHRIVCNGCQKASGKGTCEGFYVLHTITRNRIFDYLAHGKNEEDKPMRVTDFNLQHHSQCERVYKDVIQFRVSGS